MSNLTPKTKGNSGWQPEGLVKRPNDRLVSVSLFTGFAFFLPPWGTSVHISRTFSSTLFKQWNNSLVFLVVFVVLQDLQKTTLCGVWVDLPLISVSSQIWGLESTYQEIEHSKVNTLRKAKNGIKHRKSKPMWSRVSKDLWLVGRFGSLYLAAGAFSWILHKSRLFAWLAEFRNVVYPRVFPLVCVPKEPLVLRIKSKMFYGLVYKIQVILQAVVVGSCNPFQTSLVNWYLSIPRRGWQIEREWTH